MRTSIMLGLSLALLSGREIAAQDSSGALRPGETIRVYGPGKFRLTGEFMERDSVSMVIRPSGLDARRVPLDGIRKVEVRTAHKSRLGTGAAAGAGAGAVLGVVMVGAVDNDPYFNLCCSGGDYALGAVLFATAGAGIGAVIGALSHKDTWTRVPAEDWQIRPGAVPEPGDRPVAKRRQRQRRAPGQP